MYRDAVSVLLVCQTAVISALTDVQKQVRRKMVNRRRERSAVPVFGDARGTHRSSHSRSSRATTTTVSSQTNPRLHTCMIYSILMITGNFDYRRGIRVHDITAQSPTSLMGEFSSLGSPALALPVQRVVEGESHDARLATPGKRLSVVQS